MELQHKTVDKPLEYIPPIHRLPPELLTPIFLHLRKEWSKGYQADSIGSKIVSWLVVSGVCRRWRDIALDFPSLWSRIHIAYPTHILLRCVQLSKSCPLVVTANMRSSKSSYFPLKEMIGRIRRLKISIHIEHWANLDSALSQPAPFLDLLSIDGQVWYDMEPSIRCLATPCGGSIPRLSYLSLQRCAIEPTSMLFKFSNLRILEMIELSRGLSAAEMLSILRRLPHLISLRVSLVLQAPGQDVIYTPIGVTTEVVNLHSLEFLSINGKFYAQDLDFLSYLSFPSTTTLLFSSHHTTHLSSYISPITNFLSIYTEARNGVDSGHPTPTKLTLLDWPNLSFRLYNDEKTYCVFRVDCTLSYSFGDKGHRTITQSDVHKLLHRLPFPTITTFSTNFHIVNSAWPAISSSFPKLGDLSVETDMSILEVIHQDSKESTNKPIGSWTPIFPFLQEMHLEDLCLDEDSNHDLVSALQARKSASCPLNELTFTNCDFGLSYEFLKSLKKIEGLKVTNYVLEYDVFDSDLYKEDYQEIDAKGWNIDRRYFVDRYMEDEGV